MGRWETAMRPMSGWDHETLIGEQVQAQLDILEPVQIAAVLRDDMG